jgi:hypothetical protein
LLQPGRAAGRDALGREAVQQAHERGVVDANHAGAPHVGQPDDAAVHGDGARQRGVLAGPDQPQVRGHVEFTDVRQANDRHVVHAQLQVGPFPLDESGDAGQLGAATGIRSGPDRCVVNRQALLRHVHARVQVMEVEPQRRDGGGDRDQRGRTVRAWMARRAAERQARLQGARRRAHARQELCHVREVQAVHRHVPGQCLVRQLEAEWNE